MKPRDLQDLLIDLLEGAMSARDDPDDPLADFADRTDGIDRVSSYRDEDMLTYDAGFVVRMKPGTEYAVTIIRNR
ncbi:MAG: hypothetical protein JNK58_05640 [Phycisphaerae bacterium]|nr:hypothetical protein [Phycisphaerae bacterium]